MNNKPIFCFIACVTNDVQMQECITYINRLYIPEGWSIDIITIKEADSMAAGYNAAMNESDAAIKIYLHQDLFIMNRYFLFNIKKIFDSDKDIGLIGMVGYTELDPSGIMWINTPYGCVTLKNINSYRDDPADRDMIYYPSVVIDGCIMVSSVDIPWREDLFDRFDFYDASTCFEYKRRNKKVVTAVQEYPWCVHDDGNINKFFYYNKYRKVFLREYSNDFYSAEKAKPIGIDIDKNFDFDVSVERWTNMLEDCEKKCDIYNEGEKEVIRRVDKALEKNSIQAFESITQYISDEVGKTIFLSSNLVLIITITEVLKLENKHGIELFIDGISNFDELKNKYYLVNFMLRRLEYDFSDELKNEAFEIIKNVSVYMIMATMQSVISKIGHNSQLFLKLSQKYLEAGDIEMSKIYLQEVAQSQK